MQAWFTPPGSTTNLLHFDCQPGGYTFYSMTTAASDDAEHDCAQGEAGTVMYGKSQYREVNPEDKLVYLNSFADADGNPIVHPMAPGWPLFLHTTIDLVAEESDAPIARLEQARDSTKQSTFTGSVASDNGDDFALRHLHVNGLEGMNRPIVHVDVGNLQHDEKAMLPENSGAAPEV